VGRRRSLAAHALSRQRRMRRNQLALADAPDPEHTVNMATQPAFDHPVSVEDYLSTDAILT
jgi:hypothetical protein